MNTNNLKRFAREARIKLLDQVGRKLEFVLTHDTAELRGKQKEIEQLKRKITEQGKGQVIETVAYTWFNRLMALRFMDANGYTIPKVVTPLPGMTNPEILQNALGGNVEAELKLDRQRLNDLLDGKTAATDAHTEAYKMLLVASCNQWHTAMPFMFERISDYTELLLPDDLLSDYSIVADIRNGMSEEDCQQEELIGWLYQFYIADKKDDVFEGLKKNIKITAENIPAATQLFTPRWIVRYMVENTLGKLWLTLKPNSKLRQHMPYYIEVPEGNAPAPLPEGIKGVTDITFLDPCQGSGHVLVYAFDLFTKIYEEEGYNTNEIPALILEHNLFGIDIDERAAQLAAFALTMKARSYYSRFLRKPVQPHVIALENVSEETIKLSVKLPISIDGRKITDHKELSLHLLTQADTFGSLIHIASDEVKAIQIKEGSIWQEQQQELKKQAEYLSRQYHCVVTNPPYIGSKGMNVDLKQFLASNFKVGKEDVFSAFILRASSFACQKGNIGLITPYVWFFIHSFRELREHFVKNYSLNNLVQLEYNAFGPAVVPVATYTYSNTSEISNLGVYIKLSDFKGVENQEPKTLEAIHNDVPYKYFVRNSQIIKIPEYAFCFWLHPKMLNAFQNGLLLQELSQPKQGLATTDNNKFLRRWHEVSFSNIFFNCPDRLNARNSNKKWFPYNKGGDYRRWYGNNDFIVNWQNDGEEIKQNVIRKYPYLNGNPDFVTKNQESYFKEGITWTYISNAYFGVRYSGEGFVFDVAGSSLFPDKNDLILILGFLSSIVASKYIGAINPTMNIQAGSVGKIPILYDKLKYFKSEINQIVESAISIVKSDWDSNESSWEFKSHKVVKKSNTTIAKLITSLKESSNNQIVELSRLESNLNRIINRIYEIDSEECDLPVSEITLSVNPAYRFKKQDDITVDNLDSLIELEYLLDSINYSVGCIFGRYSIDKQGLILANQGEILQDFLKQVPNPFFMPDEDNIIPVLDGEWFNDDIVGRFKVFLKAAFGEEHFEENLKYIEDTIGKDIRKYFVKDFYNDHIKRYKKRPIYWMFSSPKGHFKALIYMHRYQPDLCSKMLNDYLQAFISKLEAARQTQTMLNLREDLSAREKTAAIKEIDKLELMLKDCREYEKTLFTIATQKISIDLDDGVKMNYHKFKEVLVPIKGLEKEEE